MERADRVEQEVAAIRPDEILGEKKRQLPPEVLSTVNRMLGEKAVRGSATLYQKDIVKELVASGLNQSEIYKRQWLDFEEVYREAGWHVEYDRPVYYAGENFEPHYKFRAKK